MSKKKVSRYANPARLQECDGRCGAVPEKMRIDRLPEGFVGPVSDHPGDCVSGKRTALCAGPDSVMPIGSGEHRTYLPNVILEVRHHRFRQSSFTARGRSKRAPNASTNSRPARTTTGRLSGAGLPPLSSNSPTTHRPDRFTNRNGRETIRQPLPISTGEVSPGWGSFVLSYSIVRFALNGEWAVGSMLVAETWPARLRGLVLSVDRSAWGIGAALAPPLAAPDRQVALQVMPGWPSR